MQTKIVANKVQENRIFVIQAVLNLKYLLPFDSNGFNLIYTATTQPGIWGWGLTRGRLMGGG